MIEKIIEFFCGLSLIVILIVGLCICGYYDTHYTQDATVVFVNGNEIAVEDEREQVWGFYGEGFRQGEEVEVVFYTNYTEQIEDDVVERVEKR